MKLNAKLIKWDLTLQYKYGLVQAGIIMSCLWIGVLALFTSKTIPHLFPLILLCDLATMGFMFVASMLFFERGQGSIYAVITTPVKTKEYLFSKIISLFIYILLVSLAVIIIVSLIKGLTFNIFYSVISILVTSVFFIILGIYLTTKFKSFTDFLFPSGLVLMLLFIPLLDLVNIDELKFLKYIYYLWPSHGMILLMKGIFQPIKIYDVIYAITYNSILSILLYKKCILLFNKKIIGRQGDIDE